MTTVLGIDVGGSGIKGAPVSIADGSLLTERHRIDTPQPATREKVVQTIARLIEHFSWTGPVGIGFPGVVRNGMIHTAANLDDSCIGCHLEAEIHAATNCSCFVVNDADAAGVAEMRFGAGRDRGGVVMVITVGTGIGSAVFTDGHLVTNTELGHMVLSNGQQAEKYASDATRKKRDLSWREWGERFNLVLKDLEFLFSPELFILGGGTSKKLDRFRDHLDIEVELVPAALRNMAGIVGAAVFAAERNSSLQPA